MTHRIAQKLEPRWIPNYSDQTANPRYQRRALRLEIESERGFVVQLIQAAWYWRRFSDQTTFHECVRLARGHSRKAQTAIHLLRKMDTNDTN